jgi:inhibitor of cysteine peptidase
MKSKLTLVLIIAAMAALLFACAPSKQVSVEVSCDEFMAQQHISQQVEVAVGDSFTVNLCSNRTTGFQWSETAQISDQTVLQQTNHEYLAPEETGAVGAAGQEVWTFKALKKGTSNVSLEYSRPWEGGEKGEWTFNLTVVVK